MERLYSPAAHALNPTRVDLDGRGLWASFRRKRRTADRTLLRLTSATIGFGDEIYEDYRRANCQPRVSRL